MPTNKNRRKHLRKILINNEEYLWCVVNYNCDGDGSSKFQIWKDKSKIFEELINEIITPKIVKEKIKKLCIFKNNINFVL